MIEINDLIFFNNLVWKGQKPPFLMPGSNFRVLKPSKMDKKRIRNIYANHPKTIVYQHFGFSSILRLAKARNHHFECQEVILQPKNRQNMTKREYEIFMQITLKHSYIDILVFLQFLGLQRQETTILNAKNLFCSPKTVKT